MDKLPLSQLTVNSKQEIVEKQKRKLPPLSFQLLTSQKGFAPIVLVVLLLFGIAAGTLLVQNRTNFLPTAANTDCSEQEYQDCRSLLLDGCFKLGEKAKCLDSTKEYCTEERYDYNSSKNAFFGRIKETDGRDCGLRYCGYELVEQTTQQAQRGTIHCSNTLLCTPEEYISCKKEGDPNAACRVTLDGKAKFCSDSKMFGCLDNVLIRWNETNKTWDKETDCRNNQTDNKCGFNKTTKQYACIGASPATGSVPDIPAKSCSLTCPRDSIGCYEIEGRERCVFRTTDPLSCTQKEKDFCKNPPDPRDDCEVAQAILVASPTDRKSIQFTRCTAAKGGTGTSTAVAPVKGTAPIAPTVQSGTSPQTPTTPATTTSNPATTAATTSNAGIICSSANQMINGIPCYKIGVFDQQTGLKLEEQARIASANYKIYQSVLDDLCGVGKTCLIDPAAKAAADARLKTANNATACMNPTAAAPAASTTL